jgi:hypothetical protein
LKTNDRACVSGAGHVVCGLVLSADIGGDFKLWRHGRLKRKKQSFNKR